ncbi:hypothetical protein ACN15M_004233, partial [Cronobacter sakazakii]
MSQTDTLKNTLAALTGSRLNRYRLDIPSCPSLLDVEDFSGVEAMSQLYLAVGNKVMDSRLPQG